MSESFTMIPDRVLADQPASGVHCLVKAAVLSYFVRKAYHGERVTLAQASRALRLSTKTVKKAAREIWRDSVNVTERFGKCFPELYGKNLPDLREFLSQCLGNSYRTRELREKKLTRNRTSGRFSKSENLPSTIGDSSLKSTKGIEDPGPRSERIDQAGAPDRPEDQEGRGEDGLPALEVPKEFDEPYPCLTEPWMTQDPALLTSGNAIAGQPGPEPQPVADRSSTANSERNADSEQIKPPIDRARLNGWHVAKKAYYKKTFSSGQVDYVSADITDQDELKDWTKAGIKFELIEKEETLDKSGRVIRPEAIEEETDRQKKFWHSVSQKGGQTNGKKRSRTNVQRDEDVSTLPATEAGASTTEPGRNS
jgi:hypothetical protein